ncbi:GT-D fold domain-containing glycosyltransferase [Clostridium sp. HCP1S3_B4]
MNHNIRKEIKESRYNTLLNVEDYCNYEMSENFLAESKRLKILDYEETLNNILKNPKSFCRFGDGEIDIMNGKSIPFQKFDERLARIMLEILEDEITDLYVGINYNYFHSTKMLNSYNRKFYLMDVRPYREFLLNHCSMKRKYIAAAFNQLYMFYDKYNFDYYYQRIKLLFKDKELVIFTGKGVFKELKYDVFEECKRKKVIECPSINAFSEYDNILNRARKFPQNKVLCFILGPTSKALVYQLTKEGYMAWDIGHMAKDYNMYMRNVEKSAIEINEFYKPD